MSKRYIGGRMIEFPDTNTQAVIRTIKNLQVGDRVRVSLSDAPEFSAVIVSIKGDDITVEQLYRNGTSTGRKILISERRIVAVENEQS